MRALWWVGGLMVGAIAVAVVAGALLLPRAGSMAGPGGGLMQALPAAQRLAPAPPLVFADGTGTRLTLEDFRGKVVLLNLWATWCPPCVREMPSLDRLQAQLGGDGFQVVALSIDRNGAAAVTPFFRDRGIAHLGIHVDPTGGAPLAFRAPGLPTTVLIDREGRMVARHDGPAEWDSPAALAIIQAAMRR